MPSSPSLTEGDSRSITQGLRRVLVGGPKDFRDPGVFHQLSLIAFLAWVGLGADGLSSSAYGPDECFRALRERGDFTYLAVFLAAAMALTVFVISFAYSRLIERFPSGGGGYLVASKLIGKHAGLISGCALLVDYILTITVSIASGADAVFSLLPLSWQAVKLPIEAFMLVFLVVLNIRGIKESVTFLVPVFLVFVATHLVLIGGGLIARAGAVGAMAHHVSSGFTTGVRQLGSWGLFLVFIGAYARGAGTYTGIEAVSNGLGIMREPRVRTAKRTMVYMSVSLALTASGILLCYLLFQVAPAEGKTLNGVLAEAFAGKVRVAGLPIGQLFVVITLASEGALLFVAAQTGFIDGPRVMATMAVDSWLPHRFGSLSDRLTTSNGVVLLGGASLALLFLTHGSVDALVVMYAINVFVTFSLSQLGMCRLALQERREDRRWPRRLALHGVALVMCVGILAFTVVEKFGQGAWMTVVITAATIVLCMAVRAHYARVAQQLKALDGELADLPLEPAETGPPDPALPTAVLLVRGYGGVGVHSVLSIQRTFPDYFKNLVFVSVSVIDSGSFKGPDEIAALEGATKATLDQYVALARGLGWRAAAFSATGLDPVGEATDLCLQVAKEFPRVVFFAGKLIWKRETWWQRILHNETAYQVQRRLHWKGLAMQVLPIRLGSSSPRGGNLESVTGAHPAAA